MNRHGTKLILRGGHAADSPAHFEPLGDEGKCSIDRSEKPPGWKSNVCTDVPAAGVPGLLARFLGAEGGGQLKAFPLYRAVTIWDACRADVVLGR